MALSGPGIFSARQSSLRWLRKYFPYGMIQECPDSDPDIMIDCVLCSGEVFERWVLPVLPRPCIFADQEVYRLPFNSQYMEGVGLTAQGNEA